MSASTISRRLELAATQRTDLARVHSYAMSAKECIFTAQDALSLAWTDYAKTHAQMTAEGRQRGRLLRRLERRLAKVRAELEQLDNDALAYARGGELR